MPRPLVDTKIMAENKTPKIQSLMGLNFLGGRPKISKKINNDIISALAS